MHKSKVLRLGSAPAFAAILALGNGCGLAVHHYRTYATTAPAPLADGVTAV